MKILCCVCKKYTKIPNEKFGEVIEFTGTPYDAADHYKDLGHNFDDGTTYVDHTVIEYDNEYQKQMFR